MEKSERDLEFQKSRRGMRESRYNEIQGIEGGERKLK